MSYEEIYLIKQGEIYYDVDFYHFKPAVPYGKVWKCFYLKEKAEEFKKQLIEKVFNLYKNEDTINLIDQPDLFNMFKYPDQITIESKLLAFRELLETSHIVIEEIKLDLEDYNHIENISPLKKYASWNINDADQCNKDNKYINMDYDSPEYVNILENVMDTVEDIWDASLGCSWTTIEMAWDEYLRLNE